MTFPEQKWFECPVCRADADIERGHRGLSTCSDVCEAKYEERLRQRRIHAEGPLEREWDPDDEKGWTSW